MPRVTNVEVLTHRPVECLNAGKTKSGKTT